MLRTTGAFLIGAVFVYAGFRQATLLERRARLLYIFLGVVEQARQEISVRLTALPDLVKRLKADRPELAIFFEHIERSWTQDDYLGFAGVWREALEPLDLNEEDRTLLHEAGNALGRYDAETQATALKRVTTLLERQHENARISVRQNGKLYRILGFAAGAMAVILIL